jgi:16S rRNA (cytosine967-C5)-methyltransferase
LLEVCSGTLRWKGRIDAIIDANSLKKKPSGWLRKCLCIAVYQLIAQDRTSASAVVSETVDLVRQMEGEAPAKFANALLRRVSEQGTQWRELEFPAQGTLDQQAQWASLPTWLWAKLFYQRGAEWARAYALACLDRPELWVKSRDLAKPAGGELSPGPIPRSWKGNFSGPIGENPEFLAGKWIVQDISSQTLVQEVLGHLTPGARALDLCAAPGGKTVGMIWGRLSVTASDLPGPRLTLLKETMTRTGSTVQVVEPQALAEQPEFDFVWVDAPCSGSGILRRHPDVRWLKKEQDLIALQKTQVELVKQGLGRLRPGGKLMYSVCSVLREEGPDVLDRAQVSGQVTQSWFLSPVEAPFGDGFFASLIQT